MSPQIRIVMLSAALTTGLPGCAFQNAWTGGPAGEAPEDGAETASGGESGGDSWSFVGDEGRSKGSLMSDPDAWLNDHLMSEKARQIERNLGYE